MEELSFWTEFIWAVINFSLSNAFFPKNEFQVFQEYVKMNTSGLLIL